MLTCRASPAERVGQCYRLTVPGAIVARTRRRSAACHRRDVSATGGAPTIAFSQRPGVLRVLQSTRAPPTGVGSVDHPTAYRAPIFSSFQSVARSSAAHG